MAECSEAGSNAPEQEQGLAGVGLSPSVSVHAASSQQRRMAPPAQKTGQVVMTQSENRPARRGHLISGHSTRRNRFSPEECRKAESCAAGTSAPVYRVAKCGRQRVSAVDRTKPTDGYHARHCRVPPTSPACRAGARRRSLPLARSCPFLTPDPETRTFVRAAPPLSKLQNPEPKLAAARSNPPRCGNLPHLSPRSSPFAFS